MPATREHWTPDMVRALADDGNRYEVVRGELLVTPAPALAHQRAVRLLLVAIDLFLRGEHGAEVFTAPADVELEPVSMVQPDLFVVRHGDQGAPHRWADMGIPLLAIEILSPGSARADRITKRRLYMERGVAQYWIVDLDSRLIERWRPADERPEIATDRIEWRLDDRGAALSIELLPFFAEVHAER